MFTDWNFDDNIMYTCHCYYAWLRGTTDLARFRTEVEDGSTLKGLIDFRQKTGRPMFVGEAGHLSNEQQEVLTDIFIKNNLGYTFWPYKKYGQHGSSVWFTAGSGWESIISFAKAKRDTYKNIREARPNQNEVKAAMNTFLENCRKTSENCFIDQKYINSIKL